MKFSKFGLYICCIFCIFACILIILISFNFFYFNDEVSVVILSFLVGILSSSLVVIAIQFKDYKIQKIKTINTIRYLVGVYTFELFDLINIIFTDEINRKIVNHKFSDAFLDIAVNRIKTEKTIYHKSHYLMSLRKEFLVGIGGFHPMLKKNSKNLKVSSLLHYWGLIHYVVEKVYNVYQIKNNFLWSIDFNEVKEEAELRILLLAFAQIDHERLFKKYHQAYTDVINLQKIKTVFNTDLTKKCL